MPEDRDAGVRAVLATSSFPPGRGGIESYLAELADELSPCVAVLAAGRRDGRVLPGDLSYPTVAGPGRMLWPGRGVAAAIERTARRFSTDRVLFGTPWPLGLVGPALHRRGLRYAAIVHGAELLVPAAIPAVRRAMARALAGAELLLPVSEFTAGRIQGLLAGFGHRVPRMDLLPARVDLSLFTPGADDANLRRRLGMPETKTVLCFGRLVRRKGVHRLVAAMPELSRRVPGVTLVVAGTGPEERRLRRMAARTRAPVVFLGRVSEEDAPGVYAAADVFALPVADRWFGLDVEGLGVVLLEAAAAGTPCVTGRSGGTPEAVVHGETGLVVDATDRGELVAALERLLTDPMEAARMGRKGRGYVERAFSGRKLPASLIDWLG
jgi:phosphatidylinositol alpha-1,6-mannosyltransferase